MLLASSGSTVLFRIPEKQAHFFRVNSPESGLQFSSEKLIYRFMEMFETGEGSMGRKFPEWKLHLQSQGVSSALPGGGRWQKVQAQEAGEGWSWSGLCPGLGDSAPSRGLCLHLCLCSPKMHKAIQTPCAAPWGSEAALTWRFCQREEYIYFQHFINKH